MDRLGCISHIKQAVKAIPKNRETKKREKERERVIIIIIKKSD